MPPPAPVTIATLSSNCPIVFLPLCRVASYCTLFGSSRDISGHSARLDARCDDLLFQVFLETGEPHFPADAGLLVSTERHVGRVPDAAVDLDRAYAHPYRDARGAIRIG